MDHDFIWRGEPVNFARLIRFYRFSAHMLPQSMEFWRLQVRLAIQQRREELAQSERLAA